MMAGLAPLLASLVATDVSALVQRTKRNAILYVFALLFVLTAYVALVAAGSIYLAGIWGPVVALLAVAGGTLLLALLMYLAVVIGNSAQKKRKREAAATSGGKALMATAALSALPLLMKSKPLMLVGAVIGVGLLAANKSGKHPPQV